MQVSIAQSVDQLVNASCVVKESEVDSNKDIGAIPHKGRRQGVHLPFYGCWARRWIDH